MKRKAKAPVLAAIHAAHLVPALVLARPLAAIVKRATEGFATGEAALWDPGGTILLEVVRTRFVDVGAFVQMTTWALLPWSLTLVFFWAAFVETEEASAACDAFGRAARSYASYVLVFGIGAAVRAAIVSLGLLVAARIGRDFLGSRGATWGGLGALALTIVVYAASRVFVDACFSAVPLAESGLRAIVIGGRHAMSSFAVLFAGYAWRTLLGACTVVGAAFLASALDVRRARDLAIVALAHQLALVCLLILRATWLDAVRPPQAETAR